MSIKNFVFVIFFNIIFFCSIISCGVKSRPTAPLGTSIPSYHQEFLKMPIVIPEKEPDKKDSKKQ